MSAGTTDRVVPALHTVARGYALASETSDKSCLFQETGGLGTQQSDQGFRDSQITYLGE